jgi:hypothetical protein
MLFDNIDPSIYVISEDVASSLNSFTLDFNSNMTHTKDDMNINFTKTDPRTNFTAQVSSKMIDSNVNIFEVEPSKSEYQNKLAPTLNRTLFDGDKNEINAKTRTKIYHLQLPFMRLPLKAFITQSTLSQIFYSGLLTMSASFLYSFFWFSLESIASANTTLNSTVLAISFLIGSLLSFVFTKVSLISFAFFVNFITTNCLLALEEYLFFPQIKAENKFTKSKFIFPALFVFNMTAAFAYVSTIRTMASNFCVELKHLINVIILTTTAFGFTLAAFSTSVLVGQGMSLLWSTFVIGVLGLLVSLFFRFKSKEPFTALNSPA